MALAVFLGRATGRGSLLGRCRRCCVEYVDAIDVSERILSRLDVRLRVDVAGVYMETAMGICEGFASESPEDEFEVREAASRERRGTY